jgi:hypothetical protein
VGEKFAGIEAAAGRAAETAPEDFGGIVAVVEEVFVWDERRAEGMGWEDEGGTCRGRSACEEGGVVG